MLAESEPTNLEVTKDIRLIEDPGYHHPKAWVDRCYLWLERWGVLPDELARQDRLIVEDLELRSAMKAQVQREYLALKEVEGDGGSL